MMAEIVKFGTSRSDRLAEADRRRTAVYARQVGVTRAGLEYLAKLIARGRHLSGAQEAVKLKRDDLIRWDEDASRYVPTDAGCEVVRKARNLGW